MDILITKVYQCGNSMGIVYINEKGHKVATLVGEWDYCFARKAMKYDGQCRGKHARRLYEMLEEHIMDLRERRKARKFDLAVGVEPATERQIAYALDLSRRYCRGEWATTFGSHWFRQPPTREEIARLGKRRCSDLISDLKRGH